MSSTSNLRKRLDALIQNGKTIKRSAETTLAWRSLQMAKAWLGKSVSYLTNGNVAKTAEMLGAEPYVPVSSIGELPPTGNVSESESFLSDDHLANVNAMRDAIQSEIESIEGLMPTEERQRHCYQKSLDQLVEAKMWYGFELQEMREAVNPIPPELADKPATVAESFPAPNGNQLETDPLDIKPKPFVVEKVASQSKNIGN